MVEGVDVVQLCLPHRLNVGQKIDTGSIHEAVETTKHFPGLCHTLSDRLWIGNVHCQFCTGTPGGMATQGDKPGMVAIDANDESALIQEALRGGQADATCGAHDEDAPSFERGAHERVSARAFSRPGRMASTISSQRPIQTSGCFIACSISCWLQSVQPRGTLDILENGEQ